MSFCPCRLCRSYVTVFKTLGTYWHIYGGFPALLCSPYLFGAVIITGACYPLWKEKEWWDIVLAVVPSVAGFALGGYAVLLAFGGEKFASIFAGKRNENESSPFMDVNAAFVHFIVVNTISIFYALITKAWEFENTYVNAFGFCLFVYGLLTSVAATFAIFFMSEMFDLYATPKSEPKDFQK